MKIVEVLTPPSDHHLALAAQIGCEGIVLRCPEDLADLTRDAARARAHGLEVAAVEGFLPMQRLKLRAPGWEDDLRRMQALIAAMGRLRIRILCYNFMPTGDWSRTRTELRTRGGARVTGFDLAELPAAPAPPPGEAEQLWDNLARFLADILPWAEAHGVELSMHPDDPPLSPLFGHARIMTDVAAFDRLLTLSASPANKICFCQGNFTAMGADIPATIRRFGPRINYVHFRDVEGRGLRFRETFHDQGPTDMFGAIRAYRAAGFAGPIRSDHVPMLDGETGEPGYTMLGRLFAVGYMRGLIQAAASLSGPTPAPET
ncbi:MAG: mannonate dehydratase [Opitutaceae bacterium]|nr:mannonate dehydratase [Opitutaceae bacterium]